MAPTVDQILNAPGPDPSKTERISNRTRKLPYEIHPADPTWPTRFQHFHATILSALGPSTALAIHHTGSTSVPHLPAKDVIDIDLTVPDPTDEESYVPQLEAQGFNFLLREPAWEQHRFFYRYDPAVNLHVWGPDAAEPVRHVIFRDWLRGNEKDRELYAGAKREAMEACERGGESMMEYTARKDGVIAEILERAFRAKGYIK